MVGGLHPAGHVVGIVSDDALATTRTIEPKDGHIATSLLKHHAIATGFDLVEHDPAMHFNLNAGETWFLHVVIKNGDL